MFMILYICIQKIFEQIGTLKRCGIHFDKIGNSKGTADIEYENPEHAELAIQRFNSKLLYIFNLINRS